MKYDFSGYVTKHNVRCADGRIIRHNAFKENDGQTVPLVWHHMHDDVKNVLGNVLLENREDGVYGYGTFNGTDSGNHAKTLVKHGDITSMSIYANKLSQNGDNVVHGVIREVSLVMAGANPEAKIENVAFAHSDGTVDVEEEEAVMHFYNELELYHADVYKPQDKPDLTHVDDEDNSDDETIQDVVDTMNEKQKNAMYFLIAKAIEDNNDQENDSDDSEEGEEMKHNIFDTTETEDDVLSHDAMMAVIADAKDFGSMRKAFEHHEIVIQHGIDDLDILYPEAKALTPEPEMITRRMDWVSDVWNSLKKTPFTRIKSVAADLTEDDARAKGYIKGNKKVEEQFGLLKRITTPQTVYKKQSMDRDDIIDITDFDVVAWLKREMRMMLDEELSRAVMVGDGRLVTSADKIKEDNIRPIYQDDDMYTIHWDVTAPSAMTDPNE